MKIYAEKTFIATDENMPEIMFWVEEKTSEFLSFPVAMKIQLACEEAVVNVVSYAYEGVEEDYAKPVQLVFGLDDDGMAFLEIRDSGIPFNPLENINADPTIPLEKRELGGWGRALIKETMDDVTYRYEDSKNILRMRKKDAGDGMPDFSNIPE